MHRAAQLLSLSGKAGLLFWFALGALTNVGHAPFYAWPVSVITFAVFMLVLDQARFQARPVRSGFWRGFVFALGYFAFGLYWIASAFIVRGSGYVLAMPFALLLLLSVLALFWGIAGALYVRLCRGGFLDIKGGETKQPITRIGIFTGLFFLAEYARGHVLGGFPWNLPGYMFPAGRPMSQAAAIIGIYGLTTLMFAVSGTLAVKLRSEDRRILPFFIALVVSTLIFVWGALRLSEAPIKGLQTVDGVKLRIVHANVPQSEKFDEENYTPIAMRYLRLTGSPGIEDISHVIWPEGALPGFLLEDENLMDAVQYYITTTDRQGNPHIPVFITETLRAEPATDRPGDLYFNSAAAVQFRPGQDPIITPFYDKQKLVLGGEYIPFAATARKIGLTTLSSAFESMTPGQTGNVPEIWGLPPVSIQICFEVLFPGFTPKTLSPSGEAPRWILNLSNDSWYGNSTGPRQHINQARYRAIEEGLPIVRSTSGGISGVFDPFGREIISLGVQDEGVIDTHLPGYTAPAAYKRVYNHYWALLNFILLILCAAGLQRRRKLHLALHLQ